MGVGLPIISFCSMNNVKVLNVQKKRKSQIKTEINISIFYFAEEGKIRYFNFNILKYLNFVHNIENIPVCLHEPILTYIIYN